jgi:hypothetical protein
MRLKILPVVAGTSVAVIGSVVIGLLHFSLLFGVHAWRGTTLDADVLDAHFAVFELLIGPLVLCWEAGSLLGVRPSGTFSMLQPSDWQLSLSGSLLT